MDAETYTNVQKHLHFFMRQINDDAEPLIIVSNNEKEKSVLMSKDQYDNLIENAYLHGTQANVNHIMKSWTQLKESKGKQHKWQRDC